MDEIVAVATALVEEKGLENFSLHILVTRLGTKAASLFNHVANVDEITTAVGRIALNVLNQTAQ